MSNQISIRCADDFAMGCYRAEPAGPAVGAIVVIQEIFGVNTHIREVADGYARQGYICLLYTSPSPRDLSTSRMPSSA